MFKIVMTIVTIMGGHITDRVVAEVTQAEFIENSRLACGFAASLAADRYIAKRLGASEAEIASDPAKYNYDHRTKDGPVYDVEYFSCNVPGRIKVQSKDVGHLRNPQVINGANSSMG